MIAMLAAAFLARPSLVLADGFGREAREFIREMATDAVSALTSGDIGESERADRFHRLLHDNFDIEAIGRWVMGRHWQAASDEQRLEFVSLFGNMLVASYIDRFRNYAGETLVVLDAIDAGGRDLLVRSQLAVAGNRRPVQIDWRVRAASGSWLVVDVMVEGVSLGLTQRSEFASRIRAIGGRIDLLLQDMRLRFASATGST